MIYIYGLKCPVAGVIRYVGKSIDPQKRLFGHLSAAKTETYKHHTAAWLRKILAQGLQPELIILQEVQEDQDWREAERNWISKEVELGWKLTNSTNGGEGLDFRNPEDYDRYIKNLSASLKKTFQERPELGEALRQNAIDAWADTEKRASRLQSMIEAQNRPEVKAKVSKASLEISKRPEVIAAKSEGTKTAWQDPAYRGNKMAHLQSDEFRQERSENISARWQDEEARQKLIDGRWDEEARKKAAADLEARRSSIVVPVESRKRQGSKMSKIWEDRRANPEQMAELKAKRQAGITPEGKARTAEAQRKRWEKYRAEKAARLAAEAVQQQPSQPGA